VLLLQLHDLRALLALQNQLLQEQCVEISSLQAKLRAGEKENELKDQKISRLERHLAVSSRRSSTNATPSSTRGDAKSKTTASGSRLKPIAGPGLSQASTRVGSRASSRAPDAGSDAELSYRETDKVYGFVEARALLKDEVQVPAWREPPNPISRNPRAVAAQAPDQAEVYQQSRCLGHDGKV
jgi:hypothetical protein